ncbi:hypothetical protein ASPACDRAFT_123990 [Aspergillus aculeatus ATCC 16872]|uniref:C2H2-type domain-containing protein n=1 Tax=Aspergillus aculeatus (strain ATCC 16872 / CBS 172.66 / WB 5094) TaxID=690307 RepID=A0A1L9WLY6_ASPA1|nr:uncharacterized protein ASPACDRAFT_123990 [Aspergillus aculeatus ATCC 16872]OJJ97164.1 hypothetical protein ASPACDRAFT_123990 [Aspergillus aculeatus ATCC 16872]
MSARLGHQAGPSKVTSANTSRYGVARSGPGPVNAGRDTTEPSRTGAPDDGRRIRGGPRAGPSPVVKPGGEPSPSVAAKPGERSNVTKPLNPRRFVPEPSRVQPPAAGPTTAIGRPAAGPTARGRDPTSRPVGEPASTQPPTTQPSAKVGTPATPSSTKLPEPTSVSCTYAKCGKHFPSKRDMDIHKITEHEYCERCDEDFPDEERLLLHKITSVKHIVCPVCGLEFRSSGGRDVHIRQNHRAEQTIDCRGCTMGFKSASALMQHIESNGCRRIPRARLLQQQETRLMIAEILDGDRPIRPEDFDNDDGGVMLDGTPLKSPVSPRRSPKNKTPDAKSPTSTNPSPSAGKASPPSPSNMTEKSMATAMSRLSLNDAEPDASDSALVPLPTATELEHDQTMELSLFGKPVASAGEILREITPGWDSSKFLNMCRTRYVCHCRVSYKRVEDFEAHIIEEMRDRKPLGCPRCFRNFKRSSDLVAHMETGSNRCSVASGSAYHQVLDQLTGGVVRVAGTLQDGTIKYEAGNVEPLYEPDNETTLAGIDTSYTFRGPVW